VPERPRRDVGDRVLKGYRENAVRPLLFHDGLQVHVPVTDTGKVVP